MNRLTMGQFSNVLLVIDSNTQYHRGPWNTVTK